MPYAAAMRKDKDALAVIGLLIGCIVFGLGSLIVAHLPLGSYAVAFWRIFIAFWVFAALSLLRRLAFPRHPRALAFTAAGGFFFAFDLALCHESIHAVAPGISTLLNSLQIFFLTAIGLCFFQERPNRRQLLSLCIAILGVALIASPEFSHNRRALWGFVSGILSGAALALAMSCLRKVQDYESTALLPMMCLFNLSAALTALPFALLSAAPFMPQTGGQWLWVAVYGIVMQCGAWGLVIYAIRRLSLALTGLILLSEPVAAILIDALWLGKAVAPLQWLGCLLTLAAIYLGSKARRGR